MRQNGSNPKKQLSIRLRAFRLNLFYLLRTIIQIYLRAVRSFANTLLRLVCGRKRPGKDNASPDNESILELDIFVDSISEPMLRPPIADNLYPHKEQEYGLIGDDEKQRPWYGRLTLLETFLATLITIIGLIQITIWLTAMGKMVSDLNRVEMINSLVNQTYDALGGKTITPICIIPDDHQLVYVLCEGKTMVAMDEFESGSLSVGNQNGRLVLRRFYDGGGKEILAIDRYIYLDGRISTKNRVIFQKLLGVYTCAYIDTTYGPSGQLMQTKFHGSCGADLTEVPVADPGVMLSSPPFFLPFLPYR